MSASASKGRSEGLQAAKAAEATAVAAASLLFLGAAFVTLAITVFCPELPNPLGGSQVSFSLGEEAAGNGCVCLSEYRSYRIYNFL